MWCEFGRRSWASERLVGAEKRWGPDKSPPFQLCAQKRNAKLTFLTLSPISPHLLHPAFLMEQRRGLEIRRSNRGRVIIEGLLRKKSLVVPPSIEPHSSFVHYSRDVSQRRVIALVFPPSHFDVSSQQHCPATPCSGRGREGRGPRRDSERRRLDEARIVERKEDEARNSDLRTRSGSGSGRNKREGSMDD